MSFEIEPCTYSFTMNNGHQEDVLMNAQIIGPWKHLNGDPKFPASKPSFTIVIDDKAIADELGKRYELREDNYIPEQTRWTLNVKVNMDTEMRPPSVYLTTLDQNGQAIKRTTLTAKTIGIIDSMDIAFCDARFVPWEYKGSTKCYARMVDFITIEDPLMARFAVESGDGQMPSGVEDDIPF